MLTKSQFIHYNINILTIIIYGTLKNIILDISPPWLQLISLIYDD